MHKTQTTLFVTVLMVFWPKAVSVWSFELIIYFCWWLTASRYLLSLGSIHTEMAGSKAKISPLFSLLKYIKSLDALPRDGSETVREATASRCHLGENWALVFRYLWIYVFPCHSFKNTDSMVADYCLIHNLKVALRPMERAMLGV